MIYAGVDAGSRTIKIAFYDADTDTFVAEGRRDQGVDQEALARDLRDELLATTGIAPDNIAGTVATGYGRAAIAFADTTVTEISCHAKGVRHHLPDTRTIVEIGGQDSKLIRLDANGKVRDFVMNDRCAAGTGRFLEIVAARLETPLDALGMLAETATQPAAISSMCVVFAETEIIGLLAAKTPVPDIVAGVQTAIARRVAAMAGRTLETPIAFTGGVALNSAMPHAIETALGNAIHLVPAPQMTGAYGAALLAALRCK